MATPPSRPAGPCRSNRCLRLICFHSLYTNHNLRCKVKLLGHKNGLPMRRIFRSLGRYARWHERLWRGLGSEHRGCSRKRRVMVASPHLAAENGYFYSCARRRRPALWETSAGTSSRTTTRASTVPVLAEIIETAGAGAEQLLPNIDDVLRGDRCDQQPWVALRNSAHSPHASPASALGKG